MEIERPQATEVPRFASVTKDKLNRLLEEYDEQKRAFENVRQMVNPNQGGWQRPVPQQESQELKNAIRAVKLEVREVMELVEENFARHGRYVQGLLNQAKGVAASAKKAVDGYESTPDSENLKAAVETTAHAANSLESMAKAAQAADLDYGKAWFSYRSALPKVPAEIGAKDLAEWRVDLMTRGKLVTAKVEKLLQLTVQAKAYRSLSKKLAAGGDRKSKVAEAAALKLEKKVADMLNQGIINSTKAPYQEENFLARVEGLAEIANQAKVSKLEASVSVSRLGDMQATGKNYRNQVKTMETVLSTGKKAFNPKELKANSKVFVKAEGHVLKAKKIVQTVDAAVKKAEEHVKVIKRKAG